MDNPVVYHQASELVTLEKAYITEDNLLGVIQNASVVVEEGMITWVGPAAELPLSGFSKDSIFSMQGNTVLPGMIDSHTHTVFAGNRADEFERRLSGVPYQTIAAEGGGILKTVTATRQATEEELYTTALERLQQMKRFGVTTVEVKSGYGLDWETELKCLRVIQRLKQTAGMRIVSTFMGAHDIPPEYKDNLQAYVDLLCSTMLPEVAKQKLADCCDVFCETGYFSVAQTRQIFEKAKTLGLKIKLHSDEFTALGGTELAAEMGCQSADHLLQITESGIQALSHSQTVATLLPGTAFFLRMKDYAPARKLLDAGAKVALATDFNPGSCHIDNLQWIMALGCFQMGMMPHEVIQAVTLNAAQALGLEKHCGSMGIGKQADFTVWNLTSYRKWFYSPTHNPVCAVVIDGELCELPSGFAAQSLSTCPV